jgi:hypothetical protein
MMLRRKLIGTATAAVLAGTLGMAPAAMAAPAPTAAPGAFAAAQPAPEQTTKGVTGSLLDPLTQEVIGSFSGQISDLTATTVDGVLTLTGTITGTGLPAEGVDFSTPVDATADAACDILMLDLGPLHLDLLGLVIDLNQVNLDVSAMPGPGNLLGNLLCAVTGLLDGPANPLNAITNLLNRILTGLGL